MASSASSAANRRNARKSTGPRSVSGKERSSRNALNHGILSRNLLLPDESAEEWETLLSQLMAEMKPAGTLEQILVERIAVAIWRQRRLVRVETACIRKAQEPGAIQRFHVEEWVGDNPQLVNEVLNGQGEEKRIVLFKEALAALQAKIVEAATLRSDYPLIWDALRVNAGSEENIHSYLEKHYKGRINDYIVALKTSLAKILSAYEDARIDKEAKGLPGAVELMARYQSSLDNDLYKAMRALREAQRFRRETLEGDAQQVSGFNE